MNSQRAQQIVCDWAADKFGERLGFLAADHIDEAAKEKNWRSILKYIEERRTQSRSWNIAFEMYQRYLQVRKQK